MWPETESDTQTRWVDEFLYLACDPKQICGELLLGGDISVALFLQFVSPSERFQSRSVPLYPQTFSICWETWKIERVGCLGFMGCLMTPGLLDFYLFLFLLKRAARTPPGLHKDTMACRLHKMRSAMLLVGVNSWYIGLWKLTQTAFDHWKKHGCRMLQERWKYFGNGESVFFILWEHVYLFQQFSKK